MIDTTSAEFFEAKYRTAADPWNFVASAYEQSRYDAILHTLGGKHFRNTLEPGCSIGVLTERLAACSDQVLACDLSETAVQKASHRCARLPNVTVRRASLTEIENFAPFDLVVLSEIGYYFSAVQLRSIAERIWNELPSEATLLAAHWLGSSPDHLLSGDTVHDILHQTSTCHHVLGERCEHPIHGGFRLDLWSRP